MGVTLTCQPGLLAEEGLESQHKIPQGAEVAPCKICEKQVDVKMKVT